MEGLLAAYQKHCNNLMANVFDPRVYVIIIRENDGSAAADQL